MTAIAIYELEVYKRTDELLNKIYPVLINYPKSEKFALCQEIKQNFYKLLTGISLGSSVKSKRRTYLQEADGYLQVIKVLMRLSLRRKYVSIEKVEQILNSWYGHAEQSNSYKFVQALLGKFDYIELVNKRSKGKIKKVFKIKKGVIENARKNRIIPKG